ncbi:uncharacterized protein [Solanum lycopersicum]|uniref:uncharacterized protein isoform X1 n=1 Tax=Solanum lycopersicum TaxID=4081 RepID=UPI000532BDBC|nr:uncharacterized protein LOC101265016 isoform X1 [Solanum lycopersicum]
MDSSAANSVSNSPISSAPQSPRPPPPSQPHQEVSNLTVLEAVKKEEVIEDPLDDMETEQDEKFKRYEVEARRYLMSKYFSDKTIFGGMSRECATSFELEEAIITPHASGKGNIFDVKMGINGEQVKVSRFPGYQSYADPANFDDDNSSDSVSTMETPSQSTANGHQPSQS